MQTESNCLPWPKQAPFNFLPQTCLQALGSAHCGVCQLTLCARISAPQISLLLTTHDVSVLAKSELYHTLTFTACGSSAATLASSGGTGRRGTGTCVPAPPPAAPGGPPRPAMAPPPAPTPELANQNPRRASISSVPAFASLVGAGGCTRAGLATAKG